MNNKRSSWITYTDGKAIEHLHYLPYGETQVDQRATSYAARYTFSAKEKDEETGYSYFGARYYNSDLSVWLSVDPMSDKYPNTSPYTYCRNNPIMLVDPNGMWDHEAKAIRFRNRAARKYGEDRVSDVFNKTIGDGKANYSFSIYGKGKTKYSRSGGTNEGGGPIITADKADIVVSSRHDLRDYKESFSMEGYYRGQIAMSEGLDKFGYMLKLAGEKLNIDEQEMVDAAAPYLESATTLLPPVSLANNVKTIVFGEDIFDNKASTLDKITAGTGIVLSASSIVKSFQGITLSRGERYLNRVLDLYSAGKMTVVQRKKSKK